MPILLILILALLVGTLGFWDAIGAILGAVGIVILFWLLIGLLAVVAGLWIFRRMR